jgi:hypothetical protein
MKVRNISPEPRFVPALGGLSVDVDELFDVPDDTELNWDIPGVFEVIANTPTIKKDED